MRVCATYCLHEDTAFMLASLKALGSVPVLALISEMPRHRPAWDATTTCTRKADAYDNLHRL
jgi:hypothetical protein